MLSRKDYEANGQTVNSLIFLATAYDKLSEAWSRYSPNSSVSSSFWLNFTALFSIKEMFMLGKFCYFSSLWDPIH